jgi:hypothetical protein
MPDPQAATSNVPVAIPDELHFCAQHCLTFTREKDGTLVNHTNLPGQHDEKRVFVIEKFTSDSVVIRRTDTGSNPGGGVMTGSMQYGNSSALGQGWTISWGKELNQLPGSDEERAMTAGGQGQPQMGSQGQQNLEMFQLFMGLFSSGATSSQEKPRKLYCGRNNGGQYCWYE